MQLQYSYIQFKKYEYSNVSINLTYILNYLKYTTERLVLTVNVCLINAFYMCVYMYRNIT